MPGRPLRYRRGEAMPAMKSRVVQGVFRVLRFVRLVVVAVVSLLIGVSARQLFDAYGKERIPFLRDKDTDREVYVVTYPAQDNPVMPPPVEPF